MNMVVVYVLYGAVTSPSFIGAPKVEILVPEAFQDASRCLKNLNTNKEELEKKYQLVQLKCIEKMVILK